MNYQNSWQVIIAGLKDALFYFVDCLGHAHVLLAAFERVRIHKNKTNVKRQKDFELTHAFFGFYLQHVDGSFSVKPLKQKQIVSSKCYYYYFNLFLFN